MLLGAALLSPALARTPQPPEFPDWDAKTIDRILTDSPWSRQLTAPFEYGSGASVRTEVYLTLRWSSALPVRQAEALDRWGRQGLDHPQARETLEGNAKHSILEIFGLPARMAPQGTRKLEEELAASSILSVKGRHTWRPASVTVPGHGTHLIVTLRFPKLTGLTAQDGLLDFFAQTGPLRISQKFRLKEMVYRGELAL